MRTGRVVVRRGELPHHPRHPGVLRDTFASQLLTVGVPLERIKKYLGHATISVTEKHYASWPHEEGAEGFRLGEGEVCPGFLARLVEPPQQSPPSDFTLNTLRL